MSDSSRFAAIFQEHARCDQTDLSDTSVDDLGPLLLHLVDVGRSAWPQVTLDGALFVRHLARHCPTDPDPTKALPALGIEDLYLACACACHVTEALQTLEVRYLSQVPVFLARSQTTPAFVDEVRQSVREKILIAKTGSPAIADYSGRGSLLGWIRSVTVRAALDLHRQQGRPGRGAGGDGEAAAVTMLVGVEDPELDFIKGRHRQSFKEAFQDALQALPADQRKVLRLYYVDGLNREGIGAVLGVHRSTVNRWLIDAREAAHKETRRLLRERLLLSPTEFDSLAGLLRSQLEVSLVRVLGGRAE